MPKKRKKVPRHRCRRTGKVKFTRRTAREALERGQGAGRKVEPQRTYRCEFCGWWHLTSQGKGDGRGPR